MASKTRGGGGRVGRSPQNNIAMRQYLAQSDISNIALDFLTYDADTIGSRNVDRRTLSSTLEASLSPEEYKRIVNAARQWADLNQQWDAAMQRGDRRRAAVISRKLDAVRDRYFKNWERRTGNLINFALV